MAGWLAFLVTSGTALLILSAVFQVLTRGPSAHPAAFWAMPKFGFALRIYVDGLTAVFLLLAALIAVPASFYSILYMRHYRDYSVGRYYPYFLLFLAAMYGLLSTTDMMWFFFIFWQLMTLPGYALIRFEHRKPQNVWAANKFLIMMQIACAATMVGAELLAIGGKAVSGSASLKYDFDTVSANLPLLLAHTARPHRLGLRIVPGRIRNQDGHVALRPVLAAGCAPCRAVPGKRDALGRDDQDRRLWRDAVFPVAGAGRRAGRLSAGALGHVGRGAGHDHAIHRHHAGFEAGAIQAPARLPQHWTGWLHPAGHGHVHGIAAGEYSSHGRARHHRLLSARSSTC